MATGGNETTDGGLKQLEEMVDFLPLVSLSIVKLEQVDEIRDLRHSSSIKNVKMKTIKCDLLQIICIQDY